MPSKPWQKKEWEERRKAILGDKCAICGSTKDLVIHHKYKIMPFLMRWDFIAYEMFRKENEDLFPTRDACPRCGSFAIYKRKEIKPLFRCKRCYYEFDEPIERRDYNMGIIFGNPDLRNFYFNWVKENKERITEEVRKNAEEAHKKYMTMENVITLCKKCHFRLHKKQGICGVYI
jgi:DNA-directed RNA polymerase subunit M/transcription elongation factor TFIIS